MSNTQPIQFLLHQVANNEQDRDNLNLILPAKLRCNLQLYKMLGIEDIKKVEFGNTYNSSQPFEDLEEMYQEKIIRSCLGCYQTEKNKNRSIIKAIQGETQGILYEAFDCPFRNGYDNHTALQALHKKMLELVPGYQEFIKNNK